MVVTWNIAADVAYYNREAELQARDSYYTGAREPAGNWYAPAGDFGLEDGASVDPTTFERHYFGLDGSGRSILVGSGTKGRVSAYDMAMSAPRSVALVWALASPELRAEIEAAQLRAVRAALRLLEREGTFARRGHNGQALEAVALSAALFQHGESRPAEHLDGESFGDPNLHTHAVILNMATRADGSVGALFSIAQRDLKLCVGSAYHCEFSAALAELGFEIDRVGKNEIFELRGVDDALIDYFSARRREIEAELAEHGVASAGASALAAAIAKSTRKAKNEAGSADREAIWKHAAAGRGVEVAKFSEALRTGDRVLDAEAAERRLTERLAEVPVQLTAQRSVFERKELLAAIATALVGTGLPASRIGVEAQRMVASGLVIEIDTNRFEHSRYSTPQILAAERNLTAVALRLAAGGAFELDREIVAARCAEAGLSDEQMNAALSATKAGAMAVIAGAPGTGKTMTLSVLVGTYQQAGHRVIATTSAWLGAKQLGVDLGVPSRANASLLELLRHDSTYLSSGDILVVDEAGLVDIHDLCALLAAVEEARAKIILVGDTKQLQPIGGPALSVVLRAVEAARIENIVRQRHLWARHAIRDFGQGRAAQALAAFAAHGHLIEAEGSAASIEAIVTTWKGGRGPDGPPLLMARTNAEVTAISRAIREVLRAEGVLSGTELAFPAVTPSGQTTSLSLARGDQVRFLSRNDRLGVFNGTLATVVRLERRVDNVSEHDFEVEVEVEVDRRRVVFPLREIADEKGRVRLGWAYATTIYQSQGMTVEKAVVLVDPRLDRHQIYVAASRSRGETTLVVDARAIDRHLAAELPVGAPHPNEPLSTEVRQSWLAARLSRMGAKESALEVLAAKERGVRRDLIAADGAESAAQAADRRRAKSREASLG